MAEYIEREALLQNLKRQYGEELGWWCPVNMSDIGAMIEDAPTADVAEVRHGAWVFDFELDGFNFYNCSVCGRQETLLSKESTAEYFPYCHCGAKMDGERREG